MSKNGKDGISGLTQRNRKLKLECKLRLQLCAILSQTQNHTEALQRAKESVKLIHHLFLDLAELCKLYIDKINYRENLQAAHEQSDLEEDERTQIIQMVMNSTPTKEIPRDFLDESISLVERSSLKIFPVVMEVCRRLVGNEENQAYARTINQEKGEESEEEPDMRSILGFLNQNEWVQNLNIGNIMQISPVCMNEDFLSKTRDEAELVREKFLEKLSILTVCYFCMSTEMRFLLHSRGKYLKPEVKEEREVESEYWHSKALEISCTFLPSECPLLKHILLSYQKHHDPSNQAIKEDEVACDNLAVLRPIIGVENSKYQPIIRSIKCPNQVKISPRTTKPVKTLLRDQVQQQLDCLLISNKTAIKRIEPCEDKQNQHDQLNHESILDLERQVLNMSPGIIGISNHHSTGSQGNYSLNGVEGLDNNLQVQSTTDYEGVIASIIENPKIDKRQLLQMFVGKMQMSGQLGDLSQELDFMQKILHKKIKNSFNDPYQSGMKQRISMLDHETDSLFRDIKSGSPDINNLQEEYDHLIDEISKSNSHQIINVDTIEIEEGLKLNDGKKSRSNSSKKKNSTSNSRSSKAMTAATKTKHTSSHPRNSRKQRNNIGNQQMSQIIPTRAERSGSSIRSCGIVGAQKNHIKSQKENMNTNLSQQFLVKNRASLATHTKLKKANHNMSTTSHQEIKPTTNKVLPGKITRKPQKVRKARGHKSRSSSKNRDRSNSRQNSQSATRSKLTNQTVSAPVMASVLQVTDQQKSIEQIVRQQKTVNESLTDLQKQVMQNQAILQQMTAEKSVEQPSVKRVKTQTQRSQSSQIKQMQNVNKSQKDLNPLSMARLSEPRVQTMKMSSSITNFPQRGFGTNQTEINPMKGLSRTTKKKVRGNSAQNKQFFTPNQIKSAIICEVEELKTRMKEHFRHISNLSPDKNSSSHSRSFSRSRSKSKQRSPQPKKAHIPKKRHNGNFNSAAELPSALVLLAAKLKNKGQNERSFEQIDRQIPPNQVAGVHNLSMFDSEHSSTHPRVIASNLHHHTSHQFGNVGSTHQLPQKIPVQKRNILPRKVVKPGSANFELGQAQKREYATHAQ